jgi:ParB-like chromosome segregation protein Spo0J
MVGQGTDIETLATTFTVTPAVAKQRLKLAAVSPTLHDLYAEDGMSLEQLMAFSVTDDQARQEQVCELLQTSVRASTLVGRHGTLQLVKVDPLEPERRALPLRKPDRIGRTLTRIDRSHILQNLAKGPFKRDHAIVAREKPYERRRLVPPYRGQIHILSRTERG